MIFVQVLLVTVSSYTDPVTGRLPVVVDTVSLANMSEISQADMPGGLIEVGVLYTQ